MKNYILLFIIITGLIISCGSKKKLDRNVIKFQDSVSCVRDSMKQMNVFMEKLPPTKEVTNYILYNQGYLSGMLEVNNCKLGNFAELVNNGKLHSIPGFKNFTNQELTQFVHLIIYLNNNYISACYKSYDTGLYTYEYKEELGGRLQDDRGLVIIEKGSDTLNDFDIKYKILDRKENLILVQPIDTRK